MCVEEYGTALINDISGGQMDERMFDTVARLDVPYIMMHMQGTPQDMQQYIHYDHLRMEIMQYFALRVQDLHARGVKDIIIDSEKLWPTTTSWLSIWKTSSYSNCLY